MPSDESINDLSVDGCEDTICNTQNLLTQYKPSIYHGIKETRVT
jgi:hypothetical protein